MPGITPYSAADLERLRSLQVRPQGWTHATKDQVRECRDPVTGDLVKVITDELAAVKGGFKVPHKRGFWTNDMEQHHVVSWRHSGAGT
jgi:hypothetical protein